MLKAERSVTDEKPTLWSNNNWRQPFQRKQKASEGQSKSSQRRHIHRLDKTWLCRNVLSECCHKIPMFLQLFKRFFFDPNAKKNKHLTPFENYIPKWPTLGKIFFFVLSFSPLRSFQIELSKWVGPRKPEKWRAWTTKF